MERSPTRPSESDAAGVSRAVPGVSRAVQTLPSACFKPQLRVVPAPPKVDHQLLRELGRDDLCLSSLSEKLQSGERFARERLSSEEGGEVAGEILHRSCPALGDQEDGELQRHERGIEGDLFRHEDAPHSLQEGDGLVQVPETGLDTALHPLYPGKWRSPPAFATSRFTSGKSALASLKYPALLSASRRLCRRGTVRRLSGARLSLR